MTETPNIRINTKQKSLQANTLRFQYITQKLNWNASAGHLTVLSLFPALFNFTGALVIALGFVSCKASLQCKRIHAVSSYYLLIYSFKFSKYQSSTAVLLSKWQKLFTRFLTYREAQLSATEADIVVATYTLSITAKEAVGSTLKCQFGTKKKKRFRNYSVWHLGSYQSHLYKLLSRYDKGL